MEINLTSAQHQIFFENRSKIKLVTKGRRLGYTYGMSVACIIGCLNGYKILWGDVTYGNIKRYIERYLIPICRANKIPYKYIKSENYFEIKDGYIDFRSADYPESWEGFDYDLILLNEAGIILKKAEYLWNNAILPMLMNTRKDSRLIAGGTPKGKQSLFYSLSKKYPTETYSTYDNPFLKIQDIELIKAEIPESVQRQEIYGEFIDDINSFVNESMIKIYDGSLDYYTIGVDLAFTVKTSSDYTAIVVTGYTADIVCVTEVIRLKARYDEIKNTLVSLNKKYNNPTIYIEAVSGANTTVDLLYRDTSLSLFKMNPTKDKVTRFLPIATRYEQGLIYHRPDLPKFFYDELFAFPSGSNDDMIDALTYSYQRVDNVGFFV